MKVSFEQVLAKAQEYKADMVKFLRDMVRIPSESCQEKEVVLRIKEVGGSGVAEGTMAEVLLYEERQRWHSAKDISC